MNRAYLEAMHAIQSGVAMEMNHNPAMTTPKHLRVGINSALVNDCAMARLLVKKGICTMEEYAEEVRLEANREVERMELDLSERLGTKVTLG